jgi:Flp pilus assembly pilin Flp
MTKLFIWAQLQATRLQREEGQSLVEWALILALVAVVAVTILGTIGSRIVTQLTSIANSL